MYIVITRTVIRMIYEFCYSCLCSICLLISQLLVGEDGFVGSLLEHSAADGPAAIVIDIFTLDLL